MLLLVESLKKSYDKNMVLGDVSFSLQKGEVLCITGPSGCGKTTLLRILAGLTLPDGGRVVLNDAVLSQRKKAVAPHRRGIAYAFQAPALFPHMTIGQNICFAAPSQDGLEDLCNRLGIDEIWEQRPDQVSGGQAKRAELARALAANAPLLLLDEPTAHLDAERRDAVLDVILKWAKGRQAAVLYVTHDRQELARIGAPVLQLDHGSLRRDDQ